MSDTPVDALAAKRKRGLKAEPLAAAVAAASPEPQEEPAALETTPQSAHVMIVSSTGSRKRKQASPKTSPSEHTDDGEELSFEGGEEEEGGSPASPGSKKSGKSLAGGKWSKYEDDCLRSGVEEVGAKNWKTISVRYLKGKRTDVQCLHRWQKVCVLHGCVDRSLVVLAVLNATTVPQK